MSHIANKIDASDKSLGELLHNKRFRIDVFQREYRWGKKQMEDLISDVTGSFLKSYNPSDELSEYESYDCYYMGPVVLCNTNRDISIIDGQQRLTSFSLILIYLQHLVRFLKLPIDEMKNLDEYIIVRKGGSKSLVLNVENRREVMSALMDEEHLIELLLNIDQYELSSRNLIERFVDITTMFPEALKEPRALQTFIDWLLEKVIFVQITAYSMNNAYSIFETMNDRGLNLSPTEILKGFLLSKIIEGSESNNEKADEANEFWNECIVSLRKTLGYDNSDLDFFKAWFRAKYAETKRQTKAGAENEDFELIGTQFHSWVKNNTTRMGLSSNEDYYYFIKSDLEFYSGLYQSVYQLKQSCIEGFEPIYNNSFFTIADSLYYPLMLSAVSKIDDTNTIDQKIRTIGRFIERYSNIRLLQSKSISQPVIRNAVYDLVKSIRNVDYETLSELLNAELEKLYPAQDTSHLKISNTQYLKYLMARIMHRIYSDNGETLCLDVFMPSRRKNAYVLCAIQEENTEDNIEALDYNEIANFVLISRVDVESFKKLRCVWERVEFIRDKRYTPEVSKEVNGIEQFFETRRNMFAGILNRLFIRNE